MADQAFALSPINAHSASPTDADYDAIREAFMETARGRWFLGEFARRNRSADTAMVLDAVGRIERTIAAQKAPPSDELSAALAAAKAAVIHARTAVAAALADAANDHSLASHRKSARVIREIAWGLRESGADVRICDLLDGQVHAINTACDGLAARPMRETALAAIDAALADMDRIAAGDIPEPETSAAAEEPTLALDGPEQADAAMELADATLPEPEVLPRDKPEAPAQEEPQALTQEDPAAVIAPPDLLPVAAATKHAPEAPVTSVEAPMPTAAVPGTDAVAASPSEALEAIATPAADTTIEPEPAAQATAETEPATADTVPDAIEMVEPEEPVVAPEPELADTLAYEIFAERAAPEPAPRHQTILARVELMLPVTQPGPVAELPVPADESLGASLIANGIIAKPAPPKTDPLAAIRRMTQAEKIAFFS